MNFYENLFTNTKFTRNSNNSNCSLDQRRSNPSKRDGKLKGQIQCYPTSWKPLLEGWGVPAVGPFSHRDQQGPWIDASFENGAFPSLAHLLSASFPGRLSSWIALGLPPTLFYPHPTKRANSADLSPLPPPRLTYILDAYSFEIFGFFFSLKFEIPGKHHKFVNWKRTVFTFFSRIENWNLFFFLDFLKNFSINIFTVIHIY